MEKSNKSITLYDGGGFIILLYLFGIPFGILGDFLWNLGVFWFFLPRAVPDALSRTKIRWRRRVLYSILVTAAGVVIDWAYLDITWKSHFLTNSEMWIPAMPQALQVVCLLVPMVMIALVSGALAYAFFKLESRQAVILGAFMGFLIAPWLLPTVPYIMGWVLK